VLLVEHPSELLQAVQLLMTTPPLGYLRQERWLRRSEATKTRS